MKTFQARVYVKNGNTRVPHTVQFTAMSSFSAQQQLVAQYGQGNVISVPTEVKGGAGSSNSPWMVKIG